MIFDNDKPLVRVTQIESFRRFIEQSEYDNYEITEQSVIDSISGTFQGNTKTRIGTAFHSIVETGHPVCEKAEEGVRTFISYGKEKTEPVPEGRIFNIDGNRVVLDKKQCRVALDYRNEHPYAFHEFRTYKDFGRAIVTGQADMIDRLEIRDIKTKYSSVNVDDYVKSCQWRFYLDMFGSDTFHYDIFCFHGYNEEKHGYDVRGLELTRYEPQLTCYRYDGLERDVHTLLDQFLDWCEFRNLTKYLYKTKV